MVVKEEWAYVLDFLPYGHPSSTNRIPVAQVIGKKGFILLEVVPRKGVYLKPYDEVYIGPEKREKIHHIVGRIRYNQLTPTAKSELPYIIEKIVDEREKEFVEFFNNAKPLTTRLHQLELLPGIGKKHAEKVIEEREKKPFESFEDIKNRVSQIPDPKKSIVKRVLIELEGGDKWKLFTY